MPVRPSFNESYQTIRAKDQGYGRAGPHDGLMTGHDWLGWVQSLIPRMRVVGSRPRDAIGSREACLSCRFSRCWRLIALRDVIRDRRAHARAQHVDERVGSLGEPNERLFANLRILEGTEVA